MQPFMFDPVSKYKTRKEFVPQPIMIHDTCSKHLSCSDQPFTAYSRQVIQMGLSTPLAKPRTQAYLMSPRTVSVRLHQPTQKEESGPNWTDTDLEKETFPRWHRRPPLNHLCNMCVAYKKTKICFSTSILYISTFTQT